MNKIKERIFTIKRTFQKLLSKFPVTILGIMITSVIYAVTADTNLINYEVVNNILLFTTTFISGTFLVETIFSRDNKKKKLIYCFISAVIAVVVTILINTENSLLGIETVILLSIVKRFIICYTITVTIMALYFNYKNSQKSFEEYLLHVVSNIFKTSIIYGILAIGIALVSSIFIFLILNGKNYTLILRLEILLLGLYYLPKLLYAFYDVENEISKFAKIIIKYVLDILVIISFIIIYLYFAKIIILRDIPSNQIYRIIAALFIIGCPIWMMTKFFDEDTLLDKINRRLPILFIPFIFLQIYTIGVRIINYGITEARYLCVALILFEIIYIAMYIKSKEKIGNILILIPAIVIIALIVPYINMYKVSIISQKHNLEIYNKKQNYTEADQNKIQGAYYYLKNSIEGEKIVSELLTQEDIDIIKKFTTEDRQTNDVEYIFASSNFDYINVEGYKKIYVIDSHKYFSINEEKNINYVFKDVEVNTQGDVKLKLDLTTIMENYIMNKDEIDYYIQQNCEFELNENQKVIIDSFSIDLYEELNEVSGYSITGYLLEK